MSDSTDSRPNDDGNSGGDVGDGAFSRLFKSNYSKNKITREVDKEEIIYENTVYHPKKVEVEKIDTPQFVYDMNSFPRGKLLLFNVRDFRKEMILKSRKGTDKDAEDLTSLFVDMGFIVDRHDNPSAYKLLKTVSNVAEEYHGSTLSCVVVAILSHGEDRGVIYATDREILVDDITKKFESESLAGKPKFFLFQACRGYQVMDSVKMIHPESLERDGPSKPEQNVIVSLPSGADFLYAYSTVSDHYSFRSGAGSWFIQAVCSVFRKYAHEMEVCRMLTRVNFEVANRKADTKEPTTHGKRQIASIVSQLRKDFFINPIYGELKP